ncbi:hypothetical protein PHMEG_0003613 [Phytophthora megakarya]|uniref:DDE Tnp4 domain-containing protein n=1 Tax=Phytophthora megakarya TaxID=4795 RepID=A0A225WW11_9STRA|nr:hypothetical protein PHMEG_0003613 [Phytophthora megakarya]
MLLLISAQPERPIVPNVRFLLTKLTNADSELLFRFDVSGVMALGRSFLLPEYVVTTHRDKVHFTEALSILLYRLSYPKRLYDMMQLFGRSTGQLSRIIQHMVLYLYRRFESIIYFQRRVCTERIHRYAEAVRMKGAPMSSVFGFIDGTKNAVCRPSSRPGTNENLQRQVYSGHKRVHCLNYQAVVTPDGLAIHFWGGPIEGRRHDITLLNESKLLDFLEEHRTIFDGYNIYGDPAYGVRKFIISGFKKARLSTVEQLFNSRMSSVREAVEWKFKELKTLWAFIDFKKSLRVRLSPVGKYVAISMLLSNCHCCYYQGNQISSYFNLAPPSLESYLLQ